MGTTTAPSAEQLIRLGLCMDGAWRVMAPHDPEFAFIQKFVADALRDGRFLDAFLNRVTVPHFPARAATPKHDARRKLEIESTVTAWMRRRVAGWPSDQAPPSMADDIHAAKIEIPHIPQRYIRAARWPGWKRAPGRPRKSGKNKSGV